VDVREGPNVRQAFDGASLNWKASSWNIHGFALKPVLNGTGVFDAPPDLGSTFWGVYAVHPMPAIKGGNIDLYYLGLARKDAAFDIGSANELRHTVGGRLSGSRGGWSYDSEAAFQGGTFGTRNILPGVPATIRRTHFDPSAFGRRLALARLSPAEITAIQSRT
jgi:Alginate export